MAFASNCSLCRHLRCSLRSTDTLATRTLRVGCRSGPFQSASCDCPAEATPPGVPVRIEAPTPPPRLTVRMSVTPATVHRQRLCRGPSGVRAIPREPLAKADSGAALRRRFATVHPGPETPAGQTVRARADAAALVNQRKKPSGSRASERNTDLPPIATKLLLIGDGTTRRQSRCRADDKLYRRTATARTAQPPGD